MPLDDTHQHSSASIMQADNPFTPIDLSGGDGVNVTSYGAIGDGTTDDTAAIQAAIAIASASGVGLYVPPGTYKITSTLVVEAPLSITGAGRAVSILRAGAGLSGPILLCRYDAEASAELRYGRISGLQFDGNRGVVSDSIGVSLLRCVMWTIDHCFLHDCGDCGVLFDGIPDVSYYNTIAECDLTLNDGYGIRAAGGELNRIFDNAISYNDIAGVQLRTLDRCYANIIGNNHVGIVVQSLKAYIAGNHIEKSNQWNIQIASSSADCIVVDNHSSAASQAGSASYSDVLIEGRRHTLAGNHFDSANAKYNIEEFTAGGATGDNNIFGNVYATFVTGAINAPGSVAGAGPNQVAVNGMSPQTATGLAQSGAVYQGSGAPNDANGRNGDLYFRTDTPGTVNQRIYVRSAGVWTGIA